MSLTFNVGGRAMTAEQIKAAAPKPKPKAAVATLKRVQDRSVAKESMGFVVTGYPPLEIAQAKDAHERAMHEEGGPAEPFDLGTYARKNKPTKVRAKPFTIEAAADDAAALVKRMGWHLVETTELLRG
jgi:hypothetical protein